MGRMATPKKPPNEDALPRIPFEDALRKILKAPPQHRVAKKTKKKTGS
jgi:hypothetical protein